MAIRFFHSASYATYSNSSDEASKTELPPLGVRAYVESSSKKDFNSDFDLSDILRVRKALARSVQYSTQRLARLDPVEFLYSNPAQRIAYEEQLLHTFYIVMAEYQLHSFEGHHGLAKKRVKQLERCANLLNTLRRLPPENKKQTPAEQLQNLTDDSKDKPATYIALTIVAPMIAETMLNMTTPEYLSAFKKSMSDANVYRLNWVWGGGLDRMLLDWMPENMGRTKQAQRVFAEIAPVTGYMSWVLYYCRLGIELYFLIRSTFKGSWLDPRATQYEKSRSPALQERFLSQWDLHKFSILNDTFWATANMACFFWLIGNSLLGYLGNILTGTLLLFDLTLVAWAYLEKKSEHKKVMLQYDEDLASLKTKIASEANALEKQVLQEHYQVLKAERDQCDFEWKYTEKQWMQDIGYAVLLLASFSMLCCFFFPPAAILPLTALILGTVGATLSFLITVGLHVLKTATEIEQLQAQIKKDEKQLDQLKSSVAQLKTQGMDDSDKAIKKVELQIQQLQEEIAYRQRMVNFYKEAIVLQGISEILIPAVAFAILISMPLLYGLIVLIPTVTLLIMSGSLLGLHEPTAPEEPADSLEDDLSPGLSI